MHAIYGNKQANDYKCSTRKGETTPHGKVCFYTAHNILYSLSQALKYWKKALEGLWPTPHWYSSHSLFSVLFCMIHPSSADFNSTKTIFYTWCPSCQSCFVYKTNTYCHSSNTSLNQPTLIFTLSKKQNPLAKKFCSITDTS